MADQPIQQFYNPEAAVCYGCGFNNPYGLHIQTYWDGRIGRCTFDPLPEHTAFPGFVYGGLLASLIDCHSIGTAVAALYDLEGRAPGSDPEITCVTGSLFVSYKLPTPIGTTLHLESQIKEIKPRKAVVTTELFAHGKLCVIGEVVAVRVASRLTMEG